MQHDPNARTQIIEVPLPEELTEPLPADASPVTIAARTAAETALGVHGVHHLGNLLARAADTVRARFGRSAGTTGVQVDETDGELDVVVSIVVEYPEPVVQVADEVRRQVREAVAQLNFDVVSVDVRVLDVHGPFDDEPSALDRAVEAAVLRGTPLWTSVPTARGRTRRHRPTTPPTRSTKRPSRSPVLLMRSGRMPRRIATTIGVTGERSVRPPVLR